jgi:TRAP-type uncharacterized transport system substrate-binding protein
MAREFEADDEGKTITTAAGAPIGTISSIEGDRARVTPDDSENSGLTEKVKSALGWDDSEGDQELEKDFVQDADDERVRLRGL